jgi:hypothetical protein
LNIVDRHLKIKKKEKVKNGILNILEKYEMTEFGVHFFLKYSRYTVTRLIKKEIDDDVLLDEVLIKLKKEGVI